MKSEKLPRLPDAELDVMQALWALPAPVPRAAVEQEIAKLHPMGQTALLTLLSRLQERGFVRAEKQGRSSVYTPLVTKQDYQAQQSRSFLSRLFGGDLPAFASALSASGLSREELDELRKLLGEDE